MRLAVVYVSDSNYHDLTLFSLASFARSHRAPLEFHLLQDGYQRDPPALLSAFVSARGHALDTRRIAFQAIAEGALEGRPDTYISSTTFLRAQALDMLVSDYDYILYVDGDVLAFGDFELQKLAGFDELCAACLDLSVGTGFDDPAFFFNCQTNGVSRKFFNAGVLVVNARKWRSTNATSAFVECLERHKRRCPYFTNCFPNDQCALNMMLDGNWRRLPVSCNVQKSAMHTSAWATANVRHYTGRRKFLPIRRRTCDPREYRLLRSLSSEAGLPMKAMQYDFGASYWLNRVRRAPVVARYERALIEISEGRL